MLSGLGEDVLSGSSGGLGLAEEDVGDLQDSVGGLQDVVGFLDFTSSVGDFTVTLSLLETLDLVMLDLFVTDGVLESIEYSVHGLEGTTRLQLVLDFHHDVHDAPLASVLQGVFGDDSSAGNSKGDQQDGNNFHFIY